ncbi:hypothetical protein R1sor_014798 [Riccia sorocarpa]|uniref:DUF676 domain-containing protein n=1 Tax=Riccia sorocarpa TaxID=122646 RepID=A0ABD3HGK6_9MARC
MDESERKHAFWSTWRKRNSYDCWPITLLPEYFEKKKGAEYRIRVLAMCYESRAEVKGTEGYLLVETFISSLVTSGFCQNEPCDGDVPDVPIILVGHDLGGILIKYFIMHVEDRCSKEQDDGKKEKMLNFLRNLKAVIFYATPHSGSQVLEDLANSIQEETRNQLLKLTRVLGKDIGRINTDFAKYRRGEAEGLTKPRFSTIALGPTLLTNQKGFSKVMVVGEGSARYDVDDSCWVEADHFEVCQPEGLWANSLKKLGDKVHEEILKCRESEAQRLQERFVKLKNSTLNQQPEVEQTKARLAQGVPSLAEF